jgi:outer membrane protein OmpA-like peptidoglycan-associated protein
MVEALYPVTGRMVKSYVNAEMKKLKSQVDDRLEQRIVSNPVLLPLTWLFQRKNVADAAVVDSIGLTVEELYLIRRGSGELVQRWPEVVGGSALSNSDIHMSGVITAVNEFASHALKDDGVLRGFDLDDCRIYLRASPAYLLAAKCRGLQPVGLEARLDDEFLTIIERNRRALDGGDMQPPQNLLAPLAAALTASVTAADEPKDAAGRLGFSPVKMLAWLVALPMLAWFAWSSWTTYQTNAVRSAAEGVILAADDMTGYPTTLDVSPRGRQVTLSGLAPTAATKDRVGANLTAALIGSEVRNRLAVLPNVDPEPQIAGQIAPQIAAVRKDMTALETELNRRAVRRAVERANKRLVEIGPDLGQLEQALSDEARRVRVRGMAADVQKAANELADPQLDVDVAVPLITNRLMRAADGLAGLMQGGGAKPTGTRLVGSGTPEDLAAAAERLAAITAAVTQSAQVKPVAPPVPSLTPRERLVAWTRDNAVFFGNGAEYRSADVANATIDSLAKLMTDANAYVRVVGFTDDSSPARNGPLAQSRADKVSAALAERGVPRRLIGSIGRANGADLSPEKGATSPNRRVEFEVGFNGEGG